jgi:transcriptional regulator with XRE-family HTH domain
MARYRVRDRLKLRERLAGSKRVVPHSIGSLAKEVGVSAPLVGHLLTGERETVDGEVAKRISEELAAPFDELFAPIECPPGNGHTDSRAAES